MGFVGQYAPNNTPMLTTRGHGRNAEIISMVDYAMGRKQTASDFVAPVTGTSPGGLGFTFGDTWRRTQRGTMEFNLPESQVDIMNMSLRYAFENVYVGKAMKVKTDFTCKGLSNRTPSKPANTYFDSVMMKLYLENLYRKAVWMYYTLGMVAVLLPQGNQPFNFIELLDPRHVRVFEAFGRKVVYLVPDQRMINAVKDKNGTSSPMNKDYYDMMPASWTSQLEAALLQNPHYNVLMNGQMNGEITIRLDSSEVLILENRYNTMSRFTNGYDGAPLQKYFAACEQHRMLLAGDFAAAFVSKNLLALVSNDDPKSEGVTYRSPDTPALQALAASFGNANSAQWMFGTSSLNVRYITPDPEVFGYEKHKLPLEILKNLLPGSMWYNDGTGAYASATIELKVLREEIDATNDDFDRNFWVPIFDRAADSSPKAISVANRRAPWHDKSSLIDDAILLAQTNAVYNNGGLDIRTLLETFGYDYDTILQRKKDEKDDVKSGIWVPAFESKQGIVAEEVYGVAASQADAQADSQIAVATATSKLPVPPVKGAVGAKKPAPKAAKAPAGGQSKPGSKPQSQATAGRTPRPGAKK